MEIPQEKNVSVTQGLFEAFGTTTFDNITPMTKGLSSALVFRIVVHGAPYLLRIMTRIDERNDPARQFASMKAAAEAGIAPRILHANIKDGILITDFVEPVPFPETEALARVPPLLRKLHAIPPFSQALNYVTMHNGFVWRLRSANLLPDNEIEEAFTRYAQLAAVYPRLDSDMVSCHNDLKPENILFDGRRVWLVDWEAAFRNDRYFDLSIVANFVVSTDAEERTCLEKYFGQPPDEYQRARFFLMRQMMHMLYASVFLMLGSAGKPIDLNQPLPSFRDFHRQIWAGDINLGDNDRKIVYGRIHWQQLLNNTREARFDQAIKFMSQSHTNSDDPPLLLPNEQVYAKSI